MNDSRNNSVPKRIRAGRLESLKRKIWRALLTAEQLLDHDDPLVRLKGIHALSQTAATYRAVYSDSDLEARLSALEEAAKRSQQ